MRGGGTALPGPVPMRRPYREGPVRGMRAREGRRDAAAAADAHAEARDEERELCWWGK